MSFPSALPPLASLITLITEERCVSRFKGFELLKYSIYFKFATLALDSFFSFFKRETTKMKSLFNYGLGTLLLSGTLCLSHKWPYVHNFSEIPLDKKEKIMQKCFAHRFLTPIRLGFVFIMTLCLLVFFTQLKRRLLDEK